MKLLIAILAVYIVGCICTFIRILKDFGGRSGYKQHINELYAFQKWVCHGRYDDEFLLKDSRKATNKFIITYCILWPCNGILYLWYYLDNIRIGKGL